MENGYNLIQLYYIDYVNESNNETLFFILMSTLVDWNTNDIII